MLTEITILIAGPITDEENETDAVDTAVSALQYDNYSVVSVSTKEIN